MNDNDNHFHRPDDDVLRRRALLGALALAPVVLSRRTAFAQGTIIRRPVRDMGLVGTLFTPSDSGKKPAVITLTGAGGGIHEAVAHSLAKAGFAAFALATHNVDGLPPVLQEIPLEYCQRAIDWVLNAVKPQRDFVAVRGWSRGGELALILGAMFPSVRAVLAYAPRTYVGLADPKARGRSDATTPPAWTWEGRPLAFEPLRPAMMERPNAPTLEDRFGIPVERTKGPILFVSGTMDTGISDDPVVGCRRAMRRLGLYHFPYRHEHWIYPKAGHTLAKAPPFDGDLSGGGTLEGNSRAVTDSWGRAINFLRDAMA